jgi:transcriptional regulator with XRE-family HTH domain
MAATKQPNAIDVHVGQRVRLRRMILGVGQEKLGDSLGVTFQQVQKYEKGTNRISASRLQQIANFLSVPVPYFFEDQPPEHGTSKTNADHDNGTDFLSSPQAFRLNSAFTRIKDNNVRRAVIALVRALADREEAQGKHSSSSDVTLADDHSS